MHGQLTDADRQYMIELLFMRSNGYKQSYFENLSDEELQKKYDEMTEGERHERNR